MAISSRPHGSVIGSASRAGLRRPWDRGAVLAICLLLLSTASGVAVAQGEGRGDAELATDVWDALTNGKPVLNVRGRLEIGDQDGKQDSQAYTVRTRLGYGTRPWHGGSVYADFENVASATLGSYRQPGGPDNGRTIIADNPITQVNQGFLKIHREELLDSALVGGRQRIVLDDARFIGNVVWRQNEQTYDALLLDSGLGVDGLTFKYAYLGSVKRIFGNGSTNPAFKDFDSDSHILNARYVAGDFVEAAAFVYLLDLRPEDRGTPDGSSSMTFGFRLVGDIGLSESMNLSYQASYAYQRDYGGNPIAYEAHYFLADLGLVFATLGKVGVGYELLGSDDGSKQFQTPLSTAHKFNGWADVFLDNGGPGGLRDLHIYVAPRLPWKLKMRIVYHRFWDDVAGRAFGNEIDGVLNRAINPYLALGKKAGYFVADDGGTRPSIYRVIWDLTINF